MKITMLGRSGSGKTTYMAALFEKMLENQSHGYRISPVSKQNNLRANLGERNRLYEYTFTHLGGEFPKGTKKTTTWNFNVHRANSLICNFEWIDYRGGLIDTVLAVGSNEEDSLMVVDQDEFTTHIIDSHSILIFVDAIELSSENFMLKLRKSTGASIISSLLSQIFIQNPRHELGIILVISKADSDVIQQKYKDHDFLLLREKCGKLYSNLKMLCEESDGRWVGKIAVTGCIGNNNLKTHRNGESIITEILKDPEPMNVEYPLFLLLQANLDRHLEKHFARIEQIKNSKDPNSQSKLVEMVKEFNQIQNDRDHLLRAHKDKLFPL